ncbi:MAG: protease pro-enzyme activation domain-containing protein [Acidobacteriaceae bacterium]
MPNAYSQITLTIQPSNRIVSQINESDLTSLKGNVAPTAQAQFDHGPAPASQPTGRLMLVLKPSAAQQQALTQYLQDVQNPSSAHYHQWLTPAQFGAHFGVSTSDLQTVESWLRAQGFHIVSVPVSHNMILFSGDFAQVQSAFHTSIHTFVVHGATHFANVSNPSIPAALAPVVAGVGPLNDFHPKRMAQLGPRGRYDPATHSIQPELTLFESNNTPFLYVDPADAATIYNSPNSSLNPNYTSGSSYTGAGINIGIVGDSNITMQDIQNYRTAFLGESASSANLPTVVVDGTDPGLNGDEIEALLDNEVAGGLAPQAKIYFYTSADTDLTSGVFSAMQRAINDNTVSILSISFGLCEAQLGTTGNAALNALMEQAAAQGISVTVSAGDNGSAGCDNFDAATQATGGFAVSGFASTPWDIAVGGTDYDGLPIAFSQYADDTTNGAAPYYRTAKSYIPEEPWNDSTLPNTNTSSNLPAKSGGQTNIIAGSGGASKFYSKPAYQASLTPVDGARDIPDVSLLAGNGFYNATWVVCSDNVADGVTSQTFTDCQNTNGTFSSTTYFDGVGGTSAAAPAFAGILALVEQKTGSRLGDANVILYQLAQSKYSTVFHDVTTGDNSVYCKTGSPDCGANNFLTGYNASTGYDLASGLGSVNIAALVNDWNSVSLSSTSTALNINSSTAPITAVHGTSLNFSVGINPTSATGVVGIIDTANQTSGGTSSGPQNDGQFTIPLTSGSGTATYSGLPGGSYTVSARYGGDTANASSTSAPINVTITPEASTTTLTVNAANPQTGAAITNLSNIPYGSEIYFNAQITGTAEGSNTQGVATGSVTFKNGTASVGTANVGGENLAAYPAYGSPATLPIGVSNITAQYSGDASFNASTSAAQTLTVVPDATTTTVTASPSTFNSIGPVTIQVQVTTPANIGSAPTGAVTVTTGGKTLFTTSSFTTTTQKSGTTSYTVLSASNSVATSQFASGTNVITATYSGDTNYTSSSSTTTVSDTAGVGSFTLSNSGNVNLNIGQSGQENLTLTPSGGFQSMVTFTCSSFAVGSCNGPTIDVSGTSPVPTPVGILVNGNAAPGTYPITVTGTDETGKITAQTTFNLVVNPLPANASFSLSADSPFSVAIGSSPPEKVTLTPANGYLGTANVVCAVSASTNSQTNPPTCNGAQITIFGNTAVSAYPVVNTTATTSPGSYTIKYTATDLNDSSITASATVDLTVGGSQSLSLTSSGNLSIAPGATTGNTSTITVTPSGGFTGQVNLTCKLTSSVAGGNYPPGCSLPSSVNITGSSAANATLTITTTAASTASSHPMLRKALFGGGGAVLACLLFLGIPARRRSWRTILGLLVLCVSLSTLGCGGGGSGSSTGGTAISGTTAGTYTFTVTGTDASTGKITASTTVTVTVT